MDNQNTEQTTKKKRKLESNYFTDRADMIACRRDSYLRKHENSSIRNKNGNEWQNFIWLMCVWLK